MRAAEKIFKRIIERCAPKWRCERIEREWRSVCCCRVFYSKSVALVVPSAGGCRCCKRSPHAAAATSTIVWSSASASASASASQETPRALYPALHIDLCTSNPATTYLTVLTETQSRQDVRTSLHLHQWLSSIRATISKLWDTAPDAPKKNNKLFIHASLINKKNSSLFLNI